MPLDPQAAAVLAAQRHLPPVERLTVPLARQRALAHLANQGEPESVARVGTRFIPGPTADLPVRIYHPTAGKEPWPALVHFHGGGWVTGNLDIVDRPARMLANRTGCVVVTVNYQKAPEHRFPTALDDCHAATRWVVEHAAELGVDPLRVGVSGDSAGGNLAASVCLRARDDGGPAPAFQVLIYPVTDHDLTTQSYVDNAEGFGLQRAGMAWYWGHYLADPQDGANPLASPLRAPDLSGLPPAFVATAEYDPLRDEGERYAERLRESGVAARLRRYPGMIHAFFMMAGVVDTARRLYDDIGAEVTAMLRPRG